ncbi:glucose 1-dehydrogenase [Streptomyces sp. NPDC102279]|uniref:glucose 1-dehydrogenase n=1 Tax=Streptomyces sp. NPDC102279 TaxID=3366153 RepID=UPI00382ECF2F
MQDRLTNKVVLVTGGVGGLGTTHTRRFIAEGASVMITDVLEEEGLKLAAELGGRARFSTLDVTDAARWKEVVAETEQAFGPVDVLLNNAGIAAPSPLEDLPEASFRKVVDINQVGVFLGMQAVVPSMRRAGGGSIINISSMGGLIASPGAIAYAATKWAVRGMTKAAALDLAQYGIRVNSVHPGVIRTPMLEANLSAAGIDALRQVTPVGRLGEPEEVSHLVMYLASDDSSYSTGSEFVVDGGFTAQ